MIKFNLKFLAIIFSALLSLPVLAYDLEIDGIYYDLDIVNKTLSVTSGNNKYSGDVIIPSTVTYSNQTLIVTEIGNSAFYNCINLETVVIPNSITEIERCTFQNCISLKSVEIPSSITVIGSDAFEKCSSLESVEIPNSVTEIGVGAFYNCSSLVSVNIPISVSYIASFTFYGCSSLESVEIPNSITGIGDNAFASCESLKKLIFEDGEDNLLLTSSAFQSSPLETLYLGRNLEYNYSPFSVNTGFKTVSLGEYVTDATSLYLSKSEGLETITCYNPNPPRIRDFTNFQYATLEVIVPNGALDAYKSADVWKNFWNLREAETSAIGDVLSDGTFENGPVDVYDLSGRLVKRQASEDELQELRPGIYLAPGYNLEENPDTVRN